MKTISTWKTPLWLHGPDCEPIYQYRAYIILEDIPEKISPDSFMYYSSSMQYHTISTILCIPTAISTKWSETGRTCGYWAHSSILHTVESGRIIAIFLTLYQGARRRWLLFLTQLYAMQILEGMSFSKEEMGMLMAKFISGLYPVRSEYYLPPTFGKI